MATLADLVHTDGFVIFDGAMGTMLQGCGLDDGGAPELWNVERPETIRAVHEAYLRAGARVVTTNTFGGTRPRLDMHGLGDRVEELSAAGARVAREAAAPYGALVAGGLGPTGELLEPLGTLTPDAAEELFGEQLLGLRAGGIDLVLIETMSDLAEVEAAVRAAQRVVPGLPVVATLSFDTKGRTMMGVTPAQAVTALAALGVSAVGANCGRGPEEMETVMAQMVAARPPGLLLIAQSNAGLPQLVGDHFEYDAPPAALAEHARRLREQGVDLIGACCGSTPDHLSAVREALAG
ncbi:MAG: homocysteine S-methyltransferase family protein [Kineosporiaceae bacterium]|jgi:methionine synthase I (cobalamin-dependent)